MLILIKANKFILSAGFILELTSLHCLINLNNEPYFPSNFGTNSIANFNDKFSDSVNVKLEFERKGAEDMAGGFNEEEEFEFPKLKNSVWDRDYTGCYETSREYCMG